MKNTKINIGCSSFNNSYWKGVFYPENLPRNKWFDYYCEHFSTYELNGTFYKFPTVKTLQNSYNKTPEDFIFSVKATKTITHIKKFVDAKAEIDEFYAICKEGLGDKLGPILFQLPPSFQYSEEKLQLIISSLSPQFMNVIEFRNKSWWIQEVYDELSKNNIVFCSVNYPNLPTDVIETAAAGYIRLHGNPKLFYSEYGPGEIQALYKEILQKKFSEVFVYFNNTASTAGIKNALEMKSLEELL